MAEADREGALEERAVLQAAIDRMLALGDPPTVLCCGNDRLAVAVYGILRARGTWMQALGKPLLPMTHPAYLLRNPAAKREAWADLLSLQARLR